MVAARGPPPAAVPAASAPDGRAARLDRSSASLARALAERIGEIEADGWSAPATALARYALATGERVPAARIGALLAVIEPLLGGDGAGQWAVAMRAAALAGGTASERQRIIDGLRRATALARPGTVADDGVAEDVAALVDDVVRATLVSALTDASSAGQPRRRWTACCSAAARARRPCRASRGAPRPSAARRRGVRCGA